MTERRQRILAIGVVRKGDTILVEKGYDPTKDERFFRPVGGGVEFGERSRDAVVRELREELGAEVVNPRLLGVLENIFTFDGEPGHEAVFVYEVDFADRALMDRPVIHGTESDGSRVEAVWKALSDFVPGHPPLYPDGLLDLLGRE